ncbi:uncharacterized protein DUF4239 [Actinocorallia herbida]|uniref:Uncharacterized protein DUF4239 n=1 Tax=Actinocorallia herbida TaxID=58109 RepID=A0A3N1D8B9_9ACTN|nr:DUF4239 domain-containing protein [Actinocorallia herbida]ROO89780.1 uncharacterized protein DUF4239 [Actinocorallia herbida]
MVVRSILCALAAVALVLLLAKLTERRGSWDRDGDSAPDGPTAGHAGATMSALFLLVFAIAVIVPWTAADSARQNTHAEAQSLVEAYWSAGLLPAGSRDTIRDGLRSYTAFVIDDEWPVMRDESRLTAEGWHRLDDFRGRLDALSFTDGARKDALDDIRDQVRDVYAARRQRASDVEAALPSGVLFFTVLTGLAMIVLPFLLGARPQGRALLPLALMAAMLGVGVYLVFDIDHVFAGALGVAPTAFQTAVAEFDRVPWAG